MHDANIPMLVRAPEVTFHKRKNCWMGKRLSDLAMRELKSGDVWPDVMMRRYPPRAHGVGIADIS